MAQQPGDSAAYTQATAVFSALGAVGNIVLFAAQIPNVWRLHTVEKDASLYDPLPSYTLLFAMSLWSGYAVWVLPSTQVLVANFSGVLLPLCYLCVFAFYSKGAARARIVGTTLLISAAAWLISWGVYVKSGRADAATIGGAVTVAVNFGFFVAPLNKLREAVVLRDLSRVPVALSVVSFFQGLTWIVAAVLLRDQMILIANSVGWSFAILQLAVIFYVRRRGPAPAGEASASASAVVVVAGSGKGEAAAAEEEAGGKGDVLDELGTAAVR